MILKALLPVDSRHHKCENEPQHQYQYVTSLALCRVVDTIT